jgi:hypothetical protein
MGSLLMLRHAGSMDAWQELLKKVDDGEANPA